MERLIDLGERAIIRDIISKYCAAEIGDDCAEISRPNEKIIVTTDPVPPPAAEVIGNDDNPYWKGWLLTVINASDLAAAGADPLAFFVAVEAPSEMTVDKFKSFFKGVSDACEQEGLVYSGGNIREGKDLSAVGTAIGRRDNTCNISRSGIEDGDLLVVVGEGGRFWLDALRVINGDKIADKTKSPLFAPRSQSANMRKLVKHGLLRSAMDNSDGLLSSVTQLCSINKLGAIFDLKKLPMPEGYQQYIRLVNMDAERLWLGWGDWNIVGAIDSDKLHEFKEFANKNKIIYTVCGRFSSDNKDVILQGEKSNIIAPRLESERFSKDSWFSSGIQGYIDSMRNIPLPL